MPDPDDVKWNSDASRFTMLSQLYEPDADGAILLPEYPSSNSDATVFQNRNRFVIHDPFPPPRRSLMKTLGPHHLMCCWGDRVPVTSEVPPPDILLDHWSDVFDTLPVATELSSSQLDYKPWAGQLLDSPDTRFITIYPHESLDASNQVVDPEVLHELHSKSVIAKIDCQQAQVLDSICPPCIVKLSHGYAGLGNYRVENQKDAEAAMASIKEHWPDATLVINEIVRDVVGDFGVQYYLGRDGLVRWLGFTEQQFDPSGKWSGGHFQTPDQTVRRPDFAPIVLASARYLYQHGYFGVVGVDILVNSSNQCFLVDVNPRLTGITPFLIASRLFAKCGWEFGIYRASVRFGGTFADLMKAVKSTSAKHDGRALVLAGLQDESGLFTTCHLSASGKSIAVCHNILDDLSSACR